MKIDQENKTVYFEIHEFPLFELGALQEAPEGFENYVMVGPGSRNDGSTIVREYGTHGFSWIKPSEG